MWFVNLLLNKQLSFMAEEEYQVYQDLLVVWSFHYFS